MEERNLNVIIETMERSLNQIGTGPKKGVKTKDIDVAKNEERDNESDIESAAPIKDLPLQQLQQQQQKEDGRDRVKISETIKVPAAPPSPYDSSFASYSYGDDEASISLTPPPPVATAANRVAVTTTQHLSSPSSPLSAQGHDQHHQQSKEQSQYLKLPTEILPLEGSTHEDADKASTSSSFMEYTFADEEMTNGNSTLLNSTINTYEQYDHVDSLKRYYSEENEEEEKAEICKPDVSSAHHPHYVKTRYGESPVYNPENKADYVQELYRKVIAATSNSSAANTPKNRPSPSEVLNGYVVHENVTAYNHMFRGRKRNSRGINGENSSGDDHNGCVPIWLINSTPMIKFIIVISSALLIGSLALIGIALAVSINSDADNFGSSQQTNFQNTKAPSPTTFGLFPSITASPPTVSPNANKLSSPSDGSTTTETSGSLSIPPTVSPFPSSSPSKDGTIKSKSKDPSSKRKAPSSAPSSMPQRQSPFPSTYLSSPPTKLPSSLPTFTPSTAPTPSPSKIHSPSPSIASQAESRTKQEPTTGEFYVFSRNSEGLTETSIAKLPRENNEWLIQLGNWNPHNDNTVHCGKQKYENIANIYSSSSVPVLWLPGDNEWNDCSNFPTSVEYWRDSFVGFESKQSFVDVKRQQNRKENFSFLFRKILYVGLNMVSGKVRNETIWSERLNDNIDWLNSTVADAMSGELEVLVIFGNSGNIPANEGFFRNLNDLVEEWNSDKETNRGGSKKKALPVFYIKESERDSRLNKKFLKSRDIRLVNVKGGVWPPAKISIDTVEGTFTFNDEWSLEY